MFKGMWKHRARIQDIFRVIFGPSLKSQVVNHTRKLEAVDPSDDLPGTRPTVDEEDGRTSGSIVPGCREDSLRVRKKNIADTRKDPPKVENCVMFECLEESLKRKRKLGDVMLFLRVFEGFGPKIVGILPGRAVLRAQHSCCWCWKLCEKSQFQLETRTSCT
jgi:hypothetical protein